MSGVSQPTGSLFEPAVLGPVSLRNRIIKAATFEGLSRRGAVTDALIDFHRAFAAGGVGMTTLAYCAVSPDGRGAPNEIILDHPAVPGLRRLADAVHAEGAAISAQIGHAGPVGQRRITRSKPLCASSGLSPLGTRYHAMTPADIERVLREFRIAADVVADAGFDAIELHMGHHYLLNSFLSPRFNRRKDRWGGSLENRARFPRAVARAVREAVGDRLAVTAKFEMDDGVPGGLRVGESIELARLLEADGTVDALQLTGGGSLANPMFLFRGDVPRKEFAATLPPALRAGFRLVGARFLREYPFEEAYFKPLAAQFRGALAMPLILLGGINRLDTMTEAIADGFAFVALGRALLREPDLVAKLGRGESRESLCIHCNKCMPTIYRGTHCVLVPPANRPGLRILPAGSAR
jgi:2,4-dienoyl-CoA reductase-like NADH-dependent reductase (Old Yellow Enzyme family)